MKSVAGELKIGIDAFPAKNRTRIPRYGKSYAESGQVGEHLGPLCPQMHLHAPAMRRLSEEIVNPPLDGSGASLWYQGKILEVVTHAAFSPEKELFCQRHKRLARERIEAVKSALARELEHPPSLTALGRKCGCSPCYLSRIFSEEMGMTISRYLRNLRLEAAADLLRTGRHNVTEAAMIVGYSSLSHFGKAFTEYFVIRTKAREPKAPPVK